MGGGGGGGGGGGVEGFLECIIMIPPPMYVGNCSREIGRRRCLRRHIKTAMTTGIEMRTLYPSMATHSKTHYFNIAATLLTVLMPIMLP